MKIKIILVDDHAIVRDGIKSILQSSDIFEIMGEASNFNELKNLLSKNLPDIILMDISLPDISGIEITKIVKEEFPDVKIIILSMHISEEFIFNAINAGANGYLPKNTSKNDLFNAIISVQENGDYFDLNISKIMTKGFVKLARQDSRVNNLEELLSLREIEILKMYVEGLSNKEIADKLFISIRTVESHKNHIMQKLNLKSSVDLVKFAIKQKIINID